MIQEHGRISMYKKICEKDVYIVSVTITNPTAEDGGQWRCNAFNPFGDSNANITLNFKGNFFNNFMILALYYTYL